MARTRFTVKSTAYTQFVINKHATYNSVLKSNAIYMVISIISFLTSCTVYYQQNVTEASNSLFDSLLNTCQDIDNLKQEEENKMKLAVERVSAWFLLNNYYLSGLLYNNSPTAQVCIEHRHKKLNQQSEVVASVNMTKRVSQILKSRSLKKEVFKKSLQNSAIYILYVLVPFIHPYINANIRKISEIELLDEIIQFLSSKERLKDPEELLRKSRNFFIHWISFN